MNRLALAPSIGYYTPLVLVLLGASLLPLMRYIDKKLPESESCDVNWEKDSHILALTRKAEGLQGRLLDLGERNTRELEVKESQILAPTKETRVSGSRFLTLTGAI
jgi:hypothetical protein